MDNILRTFYNNESEKEQVKSFLLLTLRELAADMAEEGKDTKGIKEAKECIDKAFDKLEEQYGIISEVNIKNSR